MQQPYLWKRRGFMQLLGGSAAVAATGGSLRWMSAGTAGGSPRWAIIGCAAGARRGGELQVFRVGSGRWTHLQTLASERPSALALHPDRHVVYVANEIDQYQGLPQATVEAYRIGAQGHLTLLNRQTLSLSGTRPRHLAVSPDGRQLAVAITGGGAYNLLPIAEDGRLQPVAAILKETGAGPIAARQAAAHPRSLSFDVRGERLLTADLGTDRVSVLKPYAEGMDHELRVAQRVVAARGSGPSQLVLHPSGRFFYVLHELDGSLTGFAYDAASGRVSGQPSHLARLPQAGRGPARLAMHPAGRFLYVSYPRFGATDGVSGHGDQIAAWRIAASTGVLQPVQAGVRPQEPARIAALAPSRDRLFALDYHGGRVLAWDLDSATGRLDRPATVAHPTTPLSLVLVG